MFGFCLARLSYLNIGGSTKSSYKNGSSPGEWYWYSHGIHRIGITLHLATIIPAGLLMVFQFVPVIRHKLLLFHRINGYIIILLVLLGNIGAIMIARRAFNGTLATQTGVGLVAIISEISIFMAYYNIKRLQIDQHRAWMLRAMFYLGTIITLRIIMIAMASISSRLSAYYDVMKCSELLEIYNGSRGDLYQFYPQCTGFTVPTNDPEVIVQATFANGQAEQIGASLHLSFGAALWLALFLHAVGVEIYLSLTPRESNRLRQASYERQMERGFANPGSAGLTVDRWGDAEPWKPMVVVKREDGGSGDETTIKHAQDAKVIGEDGNKGVVDAN